MSLYRAFLQVHVEADGIVDAYNRVEILMLHWPKGRWRYAELTGDQWSALDTTHPHFAPENDNPTE